MLSIGNIHNIANIECYPLLLMLTIVTNVVNVISQNYNFEILARFFYYIRYIYISIRYWSELRLNRIILNFKLKWTKKNFFYVLYIIHFIFKFFNYKNTFIYIITWLLRFSLQEICCLSLFFYIGLKEQQPFVSNF